MSKDFLNTGLDGPRERQFAELMRDLIEKVDGRLEAMDAKLREQAQGAAAEVAALKSATEHREATWRERFNHFADEYGRYDGRPYKGAFRDREQARGFGLLVLVKTHPDMQQRNAAQTELQKAGVSGATGAGGGFLEVDQFIPGILANVDTYSTAERIFRVWPDIAGEHVRRARRGQGATVYFPDYGQKPTESELKAELDRHDLTRWSTFAKYDRWMAKSELAVALAEYVADELGFAIALKSDQTAFIGDGSNTYARTTGVFKQPATGHLQVVADTGDDTFQEIIDAGNKYPAKALAKLPRWAHKVGPVFLMDHEIFFGFWGLQDAAGKPVVQFLGADSPAPFRMFGHPVELTGVGPNLADDAVSTPVISVGAYNRGWEIYRHRSGFELRASEHVYFLEGEIAVVLDVPQKIAEVDANSFVNIVTAAE